MRENKRAGAIDSAAQGATLETQCWFKTFKPFNRRAPINDLNCLNDLNSS
jgi:hypothetical protein